MPAMIEQFIQAGEKVCEEASVRGVGSYEEAACVLMSFIRKLEAQMPGLQKARYLRGKLYTQKGYERFMMLPDDMDDWPVRGEFPVFGHMGEYQSLVIFQEDTDGR